MINKPEHALQHEQQHTLRIPNRDTINHNKRYHYNPYKYNVGIDQIANNTKAEEPRDIQNMAELLKGLKTLTIFESQRMKTIASFDKPHEAFNGACRNHCIGCELDPCTPLLDEFETCRSLRDSAD